MKLVYSTGSLCDVLGLFLFTVSISQDPSPLPSPAPPGPTLPQFGSWGPSHSHVIHVPRALFVRKALLWDQPISDIKIPSIPY